MREPLAVCVFTSCGCGGTKRPALSTKGCFFLELAHNRASYLITSLPVMFFFKPHTIPYDALHEDVDTDGFRRIRVKEVRFGCLCVAGGRSLFGRTR